MHIDKIFFEDEVRDGFYVPADMKHAWAAQLEVLKDVDELCRRYNIQYFAEWGTMLGAVRHHGFIPWDDDMDICMKRQDYNRFLRIAEKEMPDGYHLFNISSDKDNNNMLTRIISSRTMRFDEDYLDRYNGFPFIVGIDIFPLDFIAPNKEDDDFQCEIIKIVNNVANYGRELNSMNEEPTEEILAAYEENIQNVEQLCAVSIDRNKDIVQQMNILVDQLCSLYTEEEAEYVTIMTLWVDNRSYRFPKEYYKKSVRLPFENIDIPVPYAYDAILKKKYGDYMRLVHTWDSHDYPFYMRQVDILKERKYADLWGYHDTSYSEYQAYKELIEANRMKRQIARKLAKDNNKNKKKIVFMPYKVCCWHMLDGLWHEYNDKEDIEVKVVPVPYYYKNYDGTIEPYIDTDMYPDYINVISYKEYDYKEDAPDEIIIQNPYDESNMSGTVHPDYYAKKLALYTDKLTYIPYFMTDEIDPNDMRAYRSMEAYVTVPGVIYADETIVQSEAMKELYVKKLTEFMGEESKDEWNSKINGEGYKWYKGSNADNKIYMLPDAWRRKVERPDGSYKKIILYYIGVNGFLEHGMKMFDKIHRAIKVFKENESDVVCMLSFEGDMEDILSRESEELLAAYSDIEREYVEYIIPNNQIRMAIEVCDAYYGDACAVAQKCRNEKKPVMIQDVEI